MTGGAEPHLLPDRHLEPATVWDGTPARSRTLPDRPPTLVLADQDDAARLPELRARVWAALDGGSRHGSLRGRFAAAVTEVLGNAFRHGAPPIAVRLWIGPTRLEATVTDCGQGFDDSLAGLDAPGTAASPSGAGLWVARQACDTLDAFHTPTGFTVHLTSAPFPPDATAGPATPADSATVRADRARADARALARRLREMPEVS